MTEPLGIRNNNPGNLRPSLTPWLGELAPVNNYCVFDKPENGLRAMGKNILAAHTKHRCNTITELISRWAPPSDNNDTPAYIAAVAGEVGLDADATLDFNSGSVMSSLLMAICRHENGGLFYSPTIFERAASLTVGDGLEW